MSSDKFTAGAPHPEHGPEYVQSLERGLNVLRAFDHNHPSMTLTEVATRTGMSRAAARRFLLTLEHLGYLRMAGRSFSLRPKVLEFGYPYYSSGYVWDTALPIMESLSRTVGENCLAGVLDGRGVVCVARTNVRITHVSVPVGGRLKAHVSTLGRVLLAFAPEQELENYLSGTSDPERREWLTTEIAQVRRLGYCLAESGLEEGLLSLSAPVFGAHGRQAVGALNISAHGGRISVETAEQQFVSPLREHVDEISTIFKAQPEQFSIRARPWE